MSSEIGPEMLPRTEIAQERFLLPSKTCGGISGDLESHESPDKSRVESDEIAFWNIVADAQRVSLDLALIHHY